MRFRIDLAYDGTAFHGWAVQPGLRTVQGEIEAGLNKVLRIESTKITCAGRTDAGVHARGQVAHVDLPKDTDPVLLERRLRAVLPDDITIWRIVVAPDGFDARFSAIWRRYIYRFADAPIDPLSRMMIVPVRGQIDVVTLNTAAETLLGLHDFAAFCRAREGATSIRSLQQLQAVRVPGGLASTLTAPPGRNFVDQIPEAQTPATVSTAEPKLTCCVVELTVQADAFCHQMVRSLAGALVEVATGRRDASWLTDLLDAPARRTDVPVMPARGLVLEEVGYPNDAELATRASQARAYRRLPESENCE